MQSNNRPTKKAKVRTTRRKGEGSTRNGEITTRIPKPIGVPDTTFTVLRYADVLTFASSSPIQYTFRANSLFDPDVTSTGHQPLYFDQYIASYEKYRVFKTHIRVRVTNNTQQFVNELVVIPASQIPTLTSISMAREQARSVTTGPLPAFQSVPKTIELSLSTKTVLGLQRSQIYDQDYGAIFSANPVELWYYSLYAWSSSTGIDLVVDVELIFECEFYDRAPLSLSLEERAKRVASVYAALVRPVRSATVMHN